MILKFILTVSGSAISGSNGLPPAAKIPCFSAKQASLLIIAIRSPTLRNWSLLCIPHEEEHCVDGDATGRRKEPGCHSPSLWSIRFACPPVDIDGDKVQERSWKLEVCKGINSPINTGTLGGPQEEGEGTPCFVAFPLIAVAEWAGRIIKNANKSRFGFRDRGRCEACRYLRARTEVGGF